MTVEARAIAGGFSPRARRDSVTVTHTDASGTARVVAGSPISQATPCSSASAGSSA